MHFYRGYGILCGSINRWIASTPKRKYIYRWLSATLQYLQRVSNGEIAVLHKAIDMDMAGSGFTGSDVSNVDAWEQQFR